MKKIRYDDFMVADLIEIPELRIVTGRRIFGIIIETSISNHMPYCWVRVLSSDGELYGYFADDLILINRGHDE